MHHSAREPKLLLAVVPERKELLQSRAVVERDVRPR